MFDRNRRILQIVPQLPGTGDGVGDYALNLAKALSAQHGFETVFGVARKTTVTERDGFPVISDLDAGFNLPAPDWDHVILHYANYGYQARGVPRSLRRFVEAIRPELAGRWITTFHEIYASGAPWQSAFWLRPFQVRIAHAMINASTSCIVSNPLIREIIHAYDAGKKVRLVPVMSNFGEPDLGDFSARSPNRWAICGGTALIARSLRSFEKLRPHIPPEFAPQHLDIVGGREDPAITATVNRLKRDLSVHSYCEVTVDLASEVLREAAFGWLDYFADGKIWPGMVLKSTAFAAFCAHGVIPILSHREEAISLDGEPLPGPYFLKPDSSQFPSLSELAAIRSRCFAWYRGHAHSCRAARIYAEALS